MEKVIYRTPGELLLKTRQTSKETLLFIKTLKKRKPGDLDTIVHELHAAAFSNFSCLDCANCCKTIGPRLTPSDIERLARHLKMKLARSEERRVG